MTWLLLAMAAALSPVQAGSAKPPDACKAVTLADVTAAAGPGFSFGPAAALISTSEMSSCVYQKGPGNSIAIALLGAPGGDAKAAVLARQAGQKRGGRAVTPVPGLCDAAFVVVISPTNTTLIAAKGPWQVEFQATVGKVPNADLEQKLAKAVCARLP